MTFLKTYWEETFVAAAGDPRMLIAQIVGVAAMILMFLSFHRQSKRGIVLLQMIGLVLWTIHFFLLRAYTGCVLDGISVLRNVVYMQPAERKWASSKWWPWIFAGVPLAFYLAADVLDPSVGTAQRFLDLLPLIASVVAAFGLRRKLARQVRLVCLFCSPLWLIYDLFSHSVGGTLTEIGSLISNGAAIVRLDILKKGVDPAETAAGTDGRAE